MRGGGRPAAQGVSRAVNRLGVASLLAGLSAPLALLTYGLSAFGYDDGADASDHALTWGALLWLLTCVAGPVVGWVRLGRDGERAWRWCLPAIVGTLLAVAAVALALLQEGLR